MGRCYRAHDPAWSFTPLSGAGAAATGGRFNRKGEPTLYLSLDVMTSFGECTQGFTNRLQPLTMCEYDVDCEGIADLRDDAARAAHGVTRDELACSWLTFQIAGKTAPSWLAIDRLRMAGHTGILVSSFVPGATEANINLVLWRWGPDLPHKVDVFDPIGRLPKKTRSPGPRQSAHDAPSRGRRRKLELPGCYANGEGRAHAEASTCRVSTLLVVRRRQDHGRFHTSLYANPTTAALLAEGRAWRAVRINGRSHLQH